MGGFKYVDDFDFPSDFGFSGSSKGRNDARDHPLTPEKQGLEYGDKSYDGGEDGTYVSKLARGGQPRMLAPKVPAAPRRRPMIKAPGPSAAPTASPMADALSAPGMPSNAPAAGALAGQPPMQDPSMGGMAHGGRIRKANGGGDLSRVRHGDGDWTDNLDRVRPRTGNTDAQMERRPADTDSRMEDVYTPDVYQGQDKERPQVNLARGGRTRRADGGHLMEDQVQVDVPGNPEEARRINTNNVNNFIKEKVARERGVYSTPQWLRDDVVKAGVHTPQQSNDDRLAQDVANRQVQYEDPKGEQGGFAGGGKFIQKMHLKKGALHEQLGVPADKPIPAAKLEAATHSSNPLERKRANLAETFKGFRHKD